MTDSLSQSIAIAIPTPTPLYFGPPHCPQFLEVSGYGRSVSANTALAALKITFYNVPASGVTRKSDIALGGAHLACQFPTKKPLYGVEAVKGFSIRIRRRPTLPHSRPCSTIGARELNFRVRNGNGWDLSAMATENSKIFHDGS